MDKLGMHQPRWDRRVIKSLGDEESVDQNERMVAIWQRENTMCEWSHFYDESEWSLMISMLRLLGFAYEHFRGSFFQGNALLMHFLLGPSGCSSRRSPDEAMFHDGNFDDSVSSKVFSVGWKMHHVCSLSKNVEVV